MKLLKKAVLVISLTSAALAADSTVRVELPSGTIVGSADSVESFNGIPYADPPEGPLRFKPPQKLSTPLGTFNATGRAASCPQMPAIGPLKDAQAAAVLSFDVEQVISGNPELDPPENDIGQEDCLTITVQRPLGTKAGDNLPVFFYIYGGGFAFGATNQYNATNLLKFAEERDQKFIYVAVNYRVAGFGFMGGAEILAEGSANVGLLDQRMGLEWVADNIESFGGDPGKVTIAGGSAGSISVFDQLILFNGSAEYKGKPLFHGAYMSSGNATPVDPIDSSKAQAIYNTVRDKVGCDVPDSLACIRNVSFPNLFEAVISVPRIISYNSLALSYLPRPDGRVIGDSPDVLAKDGKVHAVPMIIGDQEDEGTIFATRQYDLTSTERLVDYLLDYFFSHASRDLVQEFVATYPADSAAGSPFRTGVFNDWLYILPGYKRVAALLGDVVFTLARRLAIESILESNPDTPVWSYLNSYNYLLSTTGTSHGSDLSKFFRDKDFAANSTRTYLLNFLHKKNPNDGENVGPGKPYPSWPKWTDSQNHNLLWVKATKIELLPDDFRSDSYEIMKNHTESLRF